MYTSLAIYAASALGMVALWLMMPKRRANRGVIGGILGIIALGGFWFAAGLDKAWSVLGLPDGALAFYYVFSSLAIVSAVMVIINRRPVYSALWFVMVVLSSAGLFLTLAADFMAFAMVIIYAGAILVTYMFVIMLAQRADTPDAPPSIDVEDRYAREPLLGVLAGFFLMIVLLRVGFAAPEPNVLSGLSDEQLVGDILAERRPTTVRARIEAEADELGAIAVHAGDVQNIERVGVDLFRSHPLGIELAGVVLLVSLIGAVVIAKTTVAEEDTVVASRTPMGPERNRNVD